MMEVTTNPQCHAGCQPRRNDGIGPILADRWSDWPSKEGCPNQPTDSETVEDVVMGGTSIRAVLGKRRIEGPNYPLKIPPIG